MNIEDQLEYDRRLTRVETKIDEISTNHLPHIQKGIEDNNKKSDKILWWIIGGLTSIFITLIAHGILTYLEIKK